MLSQLAKYLCSGDFLLLLKSSLLRNILSNVINSLVTVLGSIGGISIGRSAAGGGLLILLLLGLLRFDLFDLLLGLFDVLESRSQLCVFTCAVEDKILTRLV